MSAQIEAFANLAAQLAPNAPPNPGKFISPAIAAKLAEVRPADAGEEGPPFFGGDGEFTAAFTTWPSQDLAIVVGSNAGENDAVCAATLEAIRAEMAPNARKIADLTASPGGKPRLGITIKAVQTDDGDAWEIGEVLPGSAAEKAGLKSGDRFVSINGSPMKDMTTEERRKRLASRKVSLQIDRAGKTLTIEIAP